MASPDSAEYKMLGILQSYAPDGAARQQCAEVLQQMEADHASPEQIVSYFAGALVDGLNYGNWLWVLPR